MHDSRLHSLTLAAFAACWFTLGCTLEAAERVALLIGNGEYREPTVQTEDTVYLPRIPMPAKDLKLMEGVLKKAGFDCTTLSDRSTAQMRGDVQAFAAARKGAPVVLFYYSGHGLAQDGVNYLAGVDAKVDVSDKLPALEQARRTGALSAQDFEGALANLKRRNAQEQLLPLDYVLQVLNEMSTNAGHRKIVLLDACRDPFVQSQREKQLLASKGAGIIGKGAGGLAKPAERRGMFIGFAASAGEVSLGEPTEPSLFTSAFCQEALQPGATLRDVFDNAAQKVYEKSAGLIAEERKRAAADGLPIVGVLAQEAQTPAAYSIIFPGGFSFIPSHGSDGAEIGVSGGSEGAVARQPKASPTPLSVAASQPVPTGVPTSTPARMEVAKLEPSKPSYPPASSSATPLPSSAAPAPQSPSLWQRLFGSQATPPPAPQATPMPKEPAKLDPQTAEIERELAKLNQELAKENSKRSFPSVSSNDPPGSNRPRVRTALVIGNSHYKNLRRLDACTHDAEVMAAAFQKIGISLHGGKPLFDLTADQMDTALNDFARTLGRDSEAYIYYSGHGAQIGGSNYLLPVGFDAKFESEGRRQAVSLDNILELLERTDSKLRVVILDACRDPGEFLPGEPMLKGLAHAKGLSEQRVDDPETLVCFATKHGTEALTDDTSSYYSRALAEEMVKPGRIEDVLRQVASRVYVETDKKQLPFTYGSLFRNHYFVAPETP